MKQYNQEDLNHITSIKEEAPVIKEPEKMQLPQVEIKESKEFTQDELFDALLFSQDMLERSSVLFVVLHDTAKDIYQDAFPVLHGGGVYMGVMQRHMTESGKSMLASLLKDKAKKYYGDDNIVTFEYHNVPVQIDIIKNKYPFFEHPDARFFRLTEFKIPNPMDEYLKWEDQIK